LVGPGPTEASFYVVLLTQRNCGQVVDSDDRLSYGTRFETDGPIGKGGPFAAEGVYLREKLADLSASVISTDQTPPPPSRAVSGIISRRSPHPEAVQADLQDEPSPTWNEISQLDRAKEILQILDSAANALSIRCKPIGAHRWVDRNARIKYCEALRVAIENLKLDIERTFDGGRKIDQAAIEDREELDGSADVTSTNSPGSTSPGSTTRYGTPENIADTTEQNALLLLGNTLEILEARYADAITRAARDAILMSIETSLLPRLEKWTRHRRYLELNQNFYKALGVFSIAKRTARSVAKNARKRFERLQESLRFREREIRMMPITQDGSQRVSQETIDRAELVIEYLERTMRRQLVAIGTLQKHLWRRPRLLSLPKSTTAWNTLAPKIPQWSHKALGLTELALTNPLSGTDIPEILVENEYPPRPPEILLKEALQYRLEVDVCLRANDELRLSGLERIKRFGPQILLVAFGYLLQLVIPASPRALVAAAGRTVARAKKSMQYIWRKHVVRPAKAIVMDLFFQTRPKLVNPGAIADARDSLQQMMRDFCDKFYRKMNQTELEERIEAIDMTLISGEYTKQVKNPIPNLPKIPQAVLVQVQFLKLVLLATLEAIDDLYGANQINLQLLASIPAILVSFFILRLGLRLIWATSTRRIATEESIHSKMRYHLRQIERTYLLQSSPNGTLSILGQGRIAFEVWRLARTLETFWAYFPTNVRLSFQTDLSDLMSPEGYSCQDYSVKFMDGSQHELSAWQRMRICERLRQSYRFLGLDRDQATIAGFRETTPDL